MGGLLQPVVWDVQVECSANELTTIPLPPNSTCAGYMDAFLKANMGYVVDPESDSTCSYCPYSTGADYMRTMNINESYYGWRDVSEYLDPHYVPSKLSNWLTFYVLGRYHSPLLHQLLRPRVLDDEAAD